MKNLYLTRRCALYVAAALVVLSAIGVNAQEPATPDAWPDWLQKAMAQESGRLRYSKISVGDGFLKSRLAGKPLSKPQPIDGGWYLTSNIGTAAPLECWVFSIAVDPATLAANIADGSIQASGQLNGPLGNRNIHFVDAGAYDNAPYLALEWFYTVGEAPNALVGLAKARVATLNGTTLACAHNSMGYRETFADAFEKFVRKADIANNEPAHYYEEVIVQKIGDQPIGVAHTTFTRDDAGDSNILLVESALIPVDGSTLSTSDTWHSSFSRADGTLISQVTAKSENGELTMQLALDPIDSSTWSVSGTFQGKEINAEINEARQPISEIGQMRAVQSLLTDNEMSNVTLDVWVPSADPTRFLEAGVALEAERRKDGFGTLTIGPMAIAAQFDETGSLLHGRLQAGAAEIIMERIWVGGTPP